MYPGSHTIKLSRQKIQQLLLVTDIRFLQLLRFVISISNLRVSNFSTNLHTPQKPTSAAPFGIYSRGIFTSATFFYFFTSPFNPPVSSPACSETSSIRSMLARPLLDDPVFQDDLPAVQIPCRDIVSPWCCASCGGIRCRRMFSGGAGINVLMAMLSASDG